MLNTIFVTGEGVTDIGVALNEQPIARNTDFYQGPLYVLATKLINQHLPDWHKDILIDVVFIYRSALGDVLKNKSAPVKFPSKDRAIKGHIEHSKGAYALASLAKQEKIEGRDDIAIYFHDTDGTIEELKREPKRQENRVAAIKHGFQLAEYFNGVAMVPKPTSESWLYCSCKNSPYQACAILETSLSGNKKSKNHPKVKLGEVFEPEAVDRNKLHQIVDAINVAIIDMPSFNIFRDEIK
ncbi:MAG: hypothetical protein HAW67_06455 [Endozoicomonadaceae bacterium]|nr:hypothetical protein [Endozoicomonadaceae bacterium]